MSVVQTVRTACPAPCRWHGLLALIGLSLCLATSPLHAQTTYTWQGTTSAWGTNTNWSPTGVPTATDAVIIGASSGSYAIDLGLFTRSVVALAMDSTVPGAWSISRGVLQTSGFVDLPANTTLLMNAQWKSAEPLTVLGSLGGSGLITVNSGASTLSVLSGGKITPGGTAGSPLTMTSTVATLQVNASSTLVSGNSTFAVDLNGPSSSDSLVALGNLQFDANFNLALNKLGGTYTPGSSYSYTIASGSTLNVSALTLPATYTVGGPTSVGGVNFSAAGFTSGDKFTLSQSGSSLVLTYVPVPEPLTTTAILLGGVGLWGLRRRKQALMAI